MPNDTQSFKVNVQLQQAIEALLGDRPIAYHAALAKALSSATAGIFLSQLLYWAPRTKNEGGWVWKTQEQIYDETALTRREQETARKVLRKAEVLEERRAGVPARLYFRVNIAQLVKVLSNYTVTSDTPELTSEPENDPLLQDGGIRHSSLSQPAIQDSAKPPVKLGGNRPTNSENTTETTDRDNSNIRKAPTSKNSGNGVPGSEHSPPGLTVAHQNSPDSTFRPVSPSSVNGKTTNRPGDERPYRPPTKQLEPLATALKLRGGPVTSPKDEAASPAGVPRRRGRPTAEEAEARENLRRFIADFGRELGDEAPKSSLTWAVNCMQRAGMDIGTFTSVLYEARSITQDRTATIHKLADSGDTAWRRKNKFAYFKSVVEDLLGLRQVHVDTAMPESITVDEQPSVRFGQLPPRR